MEKRFIMPAVLSILFLILATALSFLPLMSESDLTKDLIPMIPGSMVSDVIITLIIPYLFFVIMLFLGPIIAPGFVKLHKLIKLNKFDYFVTTTDKKRSGKRILTRAIFPGMLAINIAIYISFYPALAEAIYVGGSQTIKIPAFIEYASIIIGIPIACLIVIPLWNVQISGLMGAKRVESYNRPVSPDIEGVGQFYIKLLKGFVGISFIITYSLILYQYMTAAGETDSNVAMIVFLDPILIILFSLPIALIVEMREEQINAKMLKYLEKMKIDTTPKTIKIE